MRNFQITVKSEKNKSINFSFYLMTSNKANEEFSQNFDANLSDFEKYLIVSTNQNQTQKDFNSSFSILNQLQPQKEKTIKKRFI